MSSPTADITSLGRPAVSEVCDAERLGGAPRRAETTRAQNWQVWLTARPTRRTQRSVVPQNRPYLRVVGWETGHVRQAHIWMFGLGHGSWTCSRLDRCLMRIAWAGTASIAAGVIAGR
jgi:hypothetical protein